MNLPRPFLAALVPLAFAASSACAASGTGARPDIVIILADDLGYGDVSCFNPERGRIRTPHIDRLAAQGMRFTDGHSSSGVCSPSRYALLTGRYHWRTRLQSGIVGLWENALIAPGRLTIGSLAQRHGYRTACIGKWHLGRAWPIAPDQRQHFAGFGGKAGGGGRIKTVATAEARAAWRTVFSQPIPEGPTTRGFDMYFGTDVPNWPPYCFIENDRTVGFPTELLPAELLRRAQASLQGPALAGWRLEPILPTLAERAAAFIARQANLDAPYLLYLPLTAPHTPIAIDPAWRGRSGLGDYGDFVMETDAMVGRVLDAIDRAGRARDTLVLFTSDNGCAAGPANAAELEARGHFPSGPLRGYKTDVFEGGHRVPFIVRWPARVKAGATCTQLVHQADLIATLAAILDAPLPPDAGEDSFNLLPLLEGAPGPIRTHAVSCAARGVPGLRKGAWKLIRAPEPGSGAPVQLYNLDVDLAESTNRAAQQPELVAELRALMEKLITDGRSTPGPRQKNDVTVARYPAAAKAGGKAKTR